MTLSSLLSNLQHLGTAGYWLVLFLSLAEAFVFTGWVVPGTVLVVIAGGLAAQGIYDFWDLVLFASIGAAVGDGISYELGHRGKSFIKHRPFLQRQLERGKKFFLRHQGKSIFLGRFIGWIRPIVPFIAGAMEMPRPRFYTANIVSAVAWAIAYLGLGYVFGAAWQLALLWSSRVVLVLALLALLLAIVAWLWRRILRHGEEIRGLFDALWRAVKTTFVEHPTVRKWMERYPKAIRFLRERFTTKHFFGLPFTLLVIAFVYTTSLLLGVVQDYLSGDPLIEADKRLANLLFAFRSPTLLRLFYFITLFAESGIIIAVALFLTGILWRKRQRVFACSLWLTLIVSEGTTYLGKLLFHRLRPEELVRAIVEDSFSFPSGHATTAMAFYGFLAYLIIRTHRSWTVKVCAFFGAVMIVLLVDVSRLYLGVHYLSDVLAGDLVGLSALIFAISVTEWLLWQRHEDRPLQLLSPLLLMAMIELCAVITVFVFAPSPWTKAQTPNTEHIEANVIPQLFQKGTLPLYTETIIGSHQEPINLMIITPQRCLIEGFSNAHWMLADIVSLHSLKQAAKAILLNQGYPTAPMTPSFYDTRPHDLGFEKETEKQTVRSRHHARFWKTRYETAPGSSLFVGTVSLDTGVKWGGVTHTIGPDIDTERDLLVSDLKSGGIVDDIQEISLVSPTLGRNFSGDEFFTDGKAVFLTMHTCK